MFGRGDGDLEPIRSDAMRSDANRNVRESSRTPAGARGKARRPRPRRPPAGASSCPASGSQELKPVPLGKASDEELMRRTQTEDERPLSCSTKRTGLRCCPISIECVQRGGRGIDRAGSFFASYVFARPTTTRTNFRPGCSRSPETWPSISRASEAQSDPQHHRAQSGRD